MKYYLFTYTKKKQYALLVGDILVLSLSVFISYFIRVYLAYGTTNVALALSRLGPWLSIVILAHLFSLYLLDQYNLNQLVNRFRSSVMVVLSVGLAGLMISASLFFFPKYIFGRQVFLIHVLIASFLMITWRLVAYFILIKRGRAKRLAVVGNGQIISSFIEELSRIPNSGFIVKSICVSSSSSDSTFSSTALFTRHESVLDLLKHGDFDVLAFDSTNGMFSDSEIRHILQVKYRGKAVYDLHRLYENITGKVPVMYIDGRWLLSKDGLQGQVSRPYIRVKRLTDIAMSFFFLLLFSPLFMLLSCLIKVEGKGGILHRQERLGMGRKPFVCYKFRTMIEDAERLSGPVWATENDPRITPLGHFMRKTHLDELPQLYNILKGEMSFVGPRPIREYFAAQMAEKVPFYWLRYDIKPGVTGWAQANGVYAVPDGLDAFQYELFYIQNMSFFLDLLTMFKTLQTVFLGKGK
ncbi:MAG: exopolysaccharide biosynthesis polyprenyl glycosylphosphotransferase [Deltaproteobacteria bacterium]|nr:exopolysaccharide biosynthesis polyprenyl glycosylphosphotransferase [Deltaproteobacteria bacterium]